MTAYLCVIRRLVKVNSINVVKDSAVRLSMNKQIKAVLAAHKQC